MILRTPHTVGGEVSLSNNHEVDMIVDILVRSLANLAVSVLEKLGSLCLLCLLCSLRCQNIEVATSYAAQGLKHTT
jgi:hypothetical protein